MNSSARFLVLITFIFAFCFSLGAQSETQRFEIKGSNSEWFVDGKNRVGHAKIDEFLGRKSLMIKKGSHILKSGEEFSEGIIEFDVAPLDESQFIAVIFRRDTFRNYENIYLRPGRSGEYQALQYAPAINSSSTWQIYPEFMRTINIPRNKWTHVKVDVKYGGLKIYINRAAEPTLEVARLRGIPKLGSVGFWSRVYDRKSEAWSAAFSNISILPKNPSKSKLKQINPPDGIIESWKVAEPMENKKGAVSKLVSLSGWKTVKAEESGLVNLNRALGIRRGRWTAYAKTRIKSRTSKITALDFSYSDDVTIFLNGKPIFSGTNGWESRYPGYMGLVKLGNDKVFLNLKPGNNELVFAVTNQRFGWGFVAKMTEL